jgi:signal transduction histidine kinase/DNA-binding response OmpR family regulator
MSKKKLNTRIENLFADLEKETSQTLQVERSPIKVRSAGGKGSELNDLAKLFIPPPSVATESESSEGVQPMGEIYGWRWECDASGKYTYCSDEIFDVLGISPDRFLGRLFTRFQLSPGSIDLLDDYLISDDEAAEPTDIDVIYLNAQREQIPVRLTITPIFTDELQGHPTGWRGYARVISHVEIDLSQPQSVTVSPEPEEIPLAKTNLPEKNRISGHTPLSHSLQMTSLQGVRLDEEKIQTTNAPLTPFGIETIRNQKPVFEPGTTDHPAALAVPFFLHANQIGLLEIVDNTPDRIWTEDERRLVEQVTDQLTLALENARLFNETRQRAQEMTNLYDVSQSLNSATLEPEEVAKIVAQNFAEILEVDEASVSLFDSEDEALRVVSDVVRNEENTGWADTDWVGKTFPLSEYPATAKAIQTMQPLLVHASDPNADPAELAYMRQNQDLMLIVLPLIVKNQSIGIVELEMKGRDREFDPNQINLMVTMANTAAVALENAQLYQVQYETAEKLRELDKLKSQFLANMSHELRTPLNSIIGFSRVIMKGIDGPVTEMQTQDLTAIHNSGQHLLKLINDVLDISKIEAGKMELAFDDNTNITDLVNSAMSTAVGLTKDKPVKLEKVIPSDLPLVRADPTRVRQVLINFLSNAAKFTEEGVIRVEVKQVHSPKNQPEIMISVTDSGAGIAPEDQQKLFLPFSQVDTSPTRKVGGTGLGLSISRMLVELHNGRIGVESELGRGSTFWFTLPLPYKPPMSDEQKRLILVVDDDRQIINLYERYLHEHGFQVCPLTDPFLALSTARRLQPFAITLDIMMPGKDGWQVLEELKRDPETRDIPVVICSIVEEMQKGINLGAVDYLTKPILEEDLAGVLERLNGDGTIQDILVIENDQDEVHFIKKMLEARGNYQVRVASSGLEGLVAMQTKLPQLLILNILIPELEGSTFLDSLYRESAWRDIPVIILTASNVPVQQLQKLSETSMRILNKEGLGEKELLESIESALKRFEFRKPENKGEFKEEVE